MVTTFQLSERLTELCNQYELEDFERWFRDETRSFHQWADPPTERLIFEVEGVLSEYHSADRSGEDCCNDLKNLGTVYNAL